MSKSNLLLIELQNSKSFLIWKSCALRFVNILKRIAKKMKIKILSLMKIRILLLRKKVKIYRANKWKMSLSLVKKIKKLNPNPSLVNQMRKMKAKKKLQILKKMKAKIWMQKQKRTLVRLIMMNRNWMMKIYNPKHIEILKIMLIKI